jgi:hypothetical protein
MYPGAKKECGSIVGLESRSFSVARSLLSQTVILGIFQLALEPCGKKSDYSSPDLISWRVHSSFRIAVEVMCPSVAC